MQNHSISPSHLKQFQEHMQNHPEYTGHINSVIKNGVNAAAYNYLSPIRLPFTFSHELETGKVTSQKSSGRCWMFAGLNTLRYHLMEKYKLENFELSQNYPMFYDKLEKSNYFLEAILETRDEASDSRIIMWLLKNPVQDGGQWDMFASLVEKYGTVPKYAMPETFHSGNSLQMNDLITHKLREYACRLRRDHSEGTTLDRLRESKYQMLEEIYRLLCHFLGTPPTEFSFEYRDKDKNYLEQDHLTPHSFYQEYIGLPIRDYVSVINAPTRDKPFDQTYTVQYLGNVTGKQVLYLNLPIQEMKALALRQLQDKQGVWFGCDMGPQIDRKEGLMDLDLYDYSSSLHTSFGMDKAERLEYGESLLTHAMVLTGVHLKEGQPQRWKVENSWGEDAGQKGFFVMSDRWFEEFTYQVVIHKKYLDEKHLQALQKPPVRLAPWDPMGSLA